MERCERYTALLSVRLDEELTEREERELEAHLAVCPACRALESQLAAIHSAFPQVEEVPAPEGFAQGVMDRVRASEDAKPKVVPLFRGSRFKALAGLAACFVLCLGVYQAGLLGQTRQETVQMTAAAGGQMSEESQPAPSMFIAAPAESDAEAAGSEARNTPQPRAAEGQTEKKDMDTGVQSFDLTGAVEQPGDGETAEEPQVVQSQMNVPTSAEPVRYGFANEQYLRVCYGRTPQAPSARILGSGDSLAAFLAQFPADDLSQVSAAYGEEFFENNRLLAIVVEEGSGSVRHGLAPQGLERDRVTVLRQVPEEGTRDMAAWLILAEVDSSFRDGDTLWVVFEEQ